MATSLQRWLELLQHLDKIAQPADAPTPLSGIPQATALVVFAGRALICAHMTLRRLESQP